ncbi:hypothetical protein DBO86_13050 [Pseudomonas indoloxydans]|uniref:Integrase catalytic domain-containing protein n=1 Tax=Ectopseudomonas oleovorans TaxID=301 RepID=A0A2T5PLR3_ECTOL|nr:hypothetical protein DBO86_13050 [Pseudomonas indoloxydans]
MFYEYPDLEKYLIDQILKWNPSGKVYEFRIRPKDLHASFIKKIKKLGVLPDQWPFNTKYLGLRSITGFMKAVLESNFSRAVAVRGASAAQAHMSLGSSFETLLRMDDPFDCVEIDAYYIDAEFCINFKNMDGTLSRLNLKRLWLLAIVDRASTAILWFRVVYRSECSASDVVSLMSESLSQELPVPAYELPGLEEPMEKGFPSQRFPQCNQAVWGVVMLDNALAHLAKAVSEHARKQLGFAINYGPVSHFERRPNVEGLFRLIRNDVFGRIPSTTGGNPHNSRTADAEDIAVKLNVNAEALDRIIYSCSVRYNLSPTEGLGFLSPIEFMDQKLHMYGAPLMRKLVKSQRESSQTTLTIKETPTVRGSIADGRRPYVQIDRVKYTNPTLARIAGLIGKKIVIEINEQDMRSVTAFLTSGESIGVLRAVGKWGRTPHNRQTRKAINSLVSRRLLALSQIDDPILAYIDHLNGLLRRSKPRPADAMEAGRVAKQAGLELQLGRAEEEGDSPVERVKAEAPRESIVSTVMPDIKSILKSL